MKISDATQGDIIVIDAAIFHRSGVDGMYHIEENIEYVIMDNPTENTACVLIVEQENTLNNSISGLIYSVQLDFTNGRTSIESNPTVYKFKTTKKG